MNSRHWLSILWPGFLLACIFELLLFALVDPVDLHWGGGSLGLPRQAVYTLGFFVFWALASASSALTLALMATPARDFSKAPD
jgi:hypothetical protein